GHAGRLALAAGVPHQGDVVERAFLLAAAALRRTGLPFVARLRRFPAFVPLLLLVLRLTLLLPRARRTLPQALDRLEVEIHREDAGHTRHRPPQHRPPRAVRHVILHREPAHVLNGRERNKKRADKRWPAVAWRTTCTTGIPRPGRTHPTIGARALTTYTPTPDGHGRATTASRASWQRSATELPDVRWDAIVVGWGPAGATAALHLADARQHVLLLERAAYPRPKACGDLLIPDTIAALRRAGLYGAVAAEALPVDDALISSPSRIEWSIPGEYM